MTMKKWILTFVFINILIAGYALFTAHQVKKQPPLDIICESTLRLNADRESTGVPFQFYGTVVVRFKPDATGYVWLLGDSFYQGTHTNVAREISFHYQPKDEMGIYAIKIVGSTVTPRDNAPTDVIERNITGRPGTLSSYVIRRANENAYSIGSIYSPIIMCVNRSQ